MNSKWLGFVLISAIIFTLGCESMGPKSKTGALAGGGIGAVAGGVIGHQMGRGIEGAVIGAAVGAIGGGLIGDSMDKADQRALAGNPNYLTYVQIVDMAQKNVPSDVIIEEIRRTNSVYYPTAEIIDYLKKNKVSNKVIDYMLSTSTHK